MKRCILAGAIALLPIAATAGSTAIVKQVGSGNAQETYQSGDNLAITLQKGENNSARTVITGDGKGSFIIQSGTDLVRENIVTDETTVAVGSVQVSASVTGYAMVRSGTGGNDEGTVMLRFELADPADSDD
jgi:hypothetical protein